MPVIGVSHFGICVSDIDRSLAFYELLGFRFSRRRKVADSEVQRLLELDTLDVELVFVEQDGVRLELIHFARPAARPRAAVDFNVQGLTHISLKVTDFDDTLDRLEQAGVSVKRHTVGGYAEANCRFAFCTDPDGQRIELFGVYDETRPAPWQ